MMSSPPTGTVTFLFTDIEGSTQLAQAHPAVWEAARQRHDAILRAAVEAHQGHVFQVVGDAFCVAFHNASSATNASVSAQRALRAEAWGDTPIRVRIGLHTGAADVRDGDYHGYLTLAHAQRVMSAAYGGQTLVSAATAVLLSGPLPSGVTLRDMGEHRLKGLLNPEHLWQVTASDLPSEFPPLQSLNAIPNNLPIQVTSFVGRERETAEVRRLLESSRLLTLTGSGGTGKTRLSLQVAAEALDSPSAGSELAFKDGIWFIELAPLSDPALLPLTVASVLGVREEHGRPLLETLLDWFRSRQLLLILDNCEHLIDACAKLADAVLHASRETRILASSREALGIAGESAWRVPSLPTPGPTESLTLAQLAQYAAIQLFCERATQALATFSVTHANAAAIAQICYRLDGIPLAIELAAARVKALPVEKIAERLDDRFRLLTGGSRTALARQQTLRATIDWSHNLLSDAERVLLRRLSVFAGGWALEAAEDICAGDGLEVFEVVDVLTRLVDKSLVALDEGSARYRMLETVRQYARERLLDTDEGSGMRDRHLEHFLKLAEEAEPYLTSKHRKQWMTRLEAEHDNLRAALTWAVEGHTEAALHLAGALHYFWFFGNYFSEALEWYRRVLSLSDSAAHTYGRAKTLSGAGHFASVNSLHDARTWLLESIALWRTLDDKAELAHSLRYLGAALVIHDDPSGARPFIEEAVKLCREVGDNRELGLALSYLGRIVATTEHDLDLARTYLLEAIQVEQEVGDRYALGIANGLLVRLTTEAGDYASARRIMDDELRSRRREGEKWSLGMGLSTAGRIARLQGDYVSARQLHDESLEMLISIGARRDAAINMRGLGHLALEEGDHVRAVSFFTQSLAINRELAFPSGMALAVAGLARDMALAGRLRDSACVFGALEKLFPSGSDVLGDRIDRDRTLTSLHAQLGEEVFEAALSAGRELTLDQAIDLALKETNG